MLAEANKPSKEAFVTLEVEEGAGDPVYLSQVYAGDASIGLVLSAGYGHRTGKSIALCNIASEHSASGTALEIEVLGDRRRAVVCANAALYDPDNQRLRQ